MSEQRWQLVPIKEGKIDVKLPQLPPQDQTKHSNIFRSQWFNTLLFGRKGSGKTVVLSTIIKDLVSTYPLVKKVPKSNPGGHTGLKLKFGGASRDAKKSKDRYHRLLHVFIFSSTIHSDAKMQEIIRFLKKSGVTVTAKVSTFSDDGKINNIKVLKEYLQDQNKHIADLKAQKAAQEEIMKTSGLTNAANVGPIVEVPDEYDYLVVLDDLSEEIGSKNTFVPAILKSHRHFDTNVLVSTQDITDLLPSSILQADNVILFRNIPEERLDLLYPRLGLDITLNEFKKLWRHAVSQENSFLWVDVPNRRYFRKFSQEYIRK